MTILALVTSVDEAEKVVLWSANFARARNTNLVVLAWTHASEIHFPLLDEDVEQHFDERFAVEVRRVSRLAAETSSGKGEAISQLAVEVRFSRHPDPVVAALSRVRPDDINLIVAAGGDPPVEPTRSEKLSQLLRRSSCHVIVLYGGATRSTATDKVLAFASDGPNDRTAVAIAGRLATTCGSKITVATAEEDTGDEAAAVGRRALRQILREAQVKLSKQFRPRVLVTDNPGPALASIAQKSDLILLGANYRWAVPGLVDDTTLPTIALVKQSPPLRRWRRRTMARFPLLNPADYADLVQNLRQGSRWNTDFMMLLGMAAAIASMGLLQNSPAVVIGSMLLAPLMTPMLGSGLALAQANPKMARTCARSILSGCLLTLVISFVVAIASPGEELTSEVVARGDPNTLDLLIAICSGVIGAYALARPNLAGSIAGVAIAVALVPPLCSLGICLAYGQLGYASGAAILFATNLVAIVLGAAATFRAMGITASRAAPQQRRWVYRWVAVLGITMILLFLPLELALHRQAEVGKPQPLGFPMAKSVMDEVLDKVRQDPGVDVMLMARPSRADSDYDAVVYLCSAEPLPRSYGDKVIDIIRTETENPDARVIVLCVQQAWQDEPPSVSPEEQNE